MTKYKIGVALSCGAVFTSLTLLLLNLSSTARLSAVLSVILFPGGILTDSLLRPKEFSPPLLVSFANVLIYSAVAYAVVAIWCHNVPVEKMQVAAIRLLLPAVVLIALICVPSLNPLWPRGMAELTRRVESLQNAFHVGMELENARAVLQSKQIRFQEVTETSPMDVLQEPGRSITAAAGDRVISARLETEASQFPCGYDIEVVLLFGPDQRLKDQYVHRLRLCP
jgi:hypothetical protein